MTQTPPATAEETELASSPFQMSKVGRHTIVYAAGILLSKAISFMMLPIYTRFLTPSDYGVVELIEMTLDVIAILAGARIAAGIFRYYHKATSDDERNAVISTALWVLAGSYAAVGLMTFLAAPWLSRLVFDTSEYASLIRLAAVSLASSSLMIAPLTYIRAQERSTLFVITQIAQVVLQLGLNLLLLVHFDMGVRAVFISSLVTKLVLGLSLAGYLVSQVGIHFTRSATRDLLRYGIPLIGTQMATFIATFGDRYFLQHAADTAAVGLYSLAYQFGFLVAAVGYMPFEMIWDAVRFKVAKRADRDELFSRAFIYLNLMLITMALAIVLFVDEILFVMTTPAFYPAAAYVPVIVIAYVLQGWVGLQDVGIHVREKTEYHTLANWAAALTALAGYAIFIPRYLAMGAAVVTVVAFFVRYLGCYLISQRLWRVEYRWAPVAKLVGVAVAVAGVGLSLPEFALLPSLAVSAALLLLYVVAVLSVGILSPDERALVFGLLRSPWATLRRGAVGASPP
jgi:O-antigen/teichoic acid export membrane protein